MKRLGPVFLVFFAACATTTTTTTTAMSGDVSGAIHNMADAFENAMQANKLDDVVNMYAEDAVLMPPNAPAMPGRAAIRQFWAGLLSAGKTDVNLTVENVEASGNLAVERGRYDVTMPFKDNGKYIVVWRNNGGKWQIVDDIFNSNLAAQ